MTLTNIPQDTRLVEFLSAAAFLIGAIALFAYPEEYFADVNLAYIKGLFAVIGVLQIIPLFSGKDGMLLKTAMCLTSGSVWLWASFASLPKVGAYPMFLNRHEGSRQTPKHDLFESLPKHCHRGKPTLAYRPDQSC